MATKLIFATRTCCSSCFLTPTCPLPNLKNYGDVSWRTGVPTGMRYMSRAEHNVTPFGKVVGIIDPETGYTSIFDKNFLTEHGIDKSPCPRSKSPVVEPEKVVAPAADCGTKNINFYNIGMCYKS